MGVVGARADGSDYRSGSVLQIGFPSGLVSGAALLLQTMLKECWNVSDVIGKAESHREAQSELAGLRGVCLLRDRILVTALICRRRSSCRLDAAQISLMLGEDGGVKRRAACASLLRTRPQTSAAAAASYLELCLVRLAEGNLAQLKVPLGSLFFAFDPGAL